MEKEGNERDGGWARSFPARVLAAGLSLSLAADGALTLRSVGATIRLRLLWALVRIGLLGGLLTAGYLAVVFQIDWLAVAIALGVVPVGFIALLSFLQACTEEGRYRGRDMV